MLTDSLSETDHVFVNELRGRRLMDTYERTLLARRTDPFPRLLKQLFLLPYCACSIEGEATVCLCLLSADRIQFDQTRFNMSCLEVYGRITPRSCRKQFIENRGARGPRPVCPRFKCITGKGSGSPGRVPHPEQSPYVTNRTCKLFRKPRAKP